MWLRVQCRKAQWPVGRLGKQVSWLRKGLECKVKMFWFIPCSGEMGKMLSRKIQ